MSSGENALRQSPNSLKRNDRDRSWSQECWPINHTFKAGEHHILIWWLLRPQEWQTKEPQVQTCPLLMQLCPSRTSTLIIMHLHCTYTALPDKQMLWWFHKPHRVKNTPSKWLETASIRDHPTVPHSTPLAQRAPIISNPITTWGLVPPPGTCLLSHLRNVFSFNKTALCWLLSF